MQVRRMAKATPAAPITPTAPPRSMLISQLDSLTLQHLPALGIGMRGGIADRFIEEWQSGRGAPLAAILQETTVGDCHG
jgi:hypothetical protein